MHHLIAYLTANVVVEVFWKLSANFVILIDCCQKLLTSGIPVADSEGVVHEPSVNSEETTDDVDEDDESKDISWLESTSSFSFLL